MSQAKGTDGSGGGSTATSRERSLSIKKAQESPLPSLHIKKILVFCLYQLIGVIPSKIYLCSNSRESANKSITSGKDSFTECCILMIRKIL